MINLKDILGLRFAAELSLREIARSQKLSVGVVSKYIRREEQLRLGRPLPETLTDQALLSALQPPRQSAESAAFGEPDFAQIQQ